MPSAPDTVTLPVASLKHTTLVWEVIVPVSGRDAERTVTVRLHVELNAAGSVTEYVTFVIPSLNVYVPIIFIPVAGDEAVVAPLMVQVTDDTEQLSLLTGSVTATDAVVCPVAAVWVMLPGQVTVGASVSLTVTVNEQAMLTFAAASVAV